jgi:hypothetical protein
VTSIFDNASDRLSACNDRRAIRSDANSHLELGSSTVKLIGVIAAAPLFGPPGYEIDLLYFFSYPRSALSRGMDRGEVDSLRPRRSPTLQFVAYTAMIYHVARQTRLPVRRRALKAEALR